ncbi:drug resistance transporter, EmrB/QacA subfamily [Clostridium cavendishii DSM 21758]|uniref:Drug resistance transporter, EmrB/QacA subfamily n=1 Tax=Clostridium cavendishii DSM 21758 TaxID=1121302 RepID=A0A1M6F8C1_9CLOT|nr:MDR family MFS transporter [Clostridium cavendishii]SHI94004.1 drug resistance transporter, EmrB/QacA subfamily [Clostridium cavendishii DSM 21758]
MNKTGSISKRERNLIVIIIIVGSFLTSLNQTVLTSALPTIMKDFNIDANIGQWLTTVYLLILGVIIPTTAFLVNKISTRKLYISALGLFLLGCIFSICAKNISVMIISRIIQAIGAGVLAQLVQVVILNLYPKENRGKAMGIYGLTVGFAPAVGPTFSGFIIDFSGWRSLFYMLAIISLLDIIVAIFALKNVGETNDDNKLDIISVILSTLGFGGILIGASNQGSYGWESRLTYIPLIVGIMSIICFTLRQIKIKNPLLELEVFKSRDFTVSTILICIAYAAMMSATILLSIYIQSLRGYSAVTSGLVMLPGSFLFAILSPVTGRLLDKYGPRVLCILGMISFGVGTFTFSYLGENTSLIYVTIMFCLRMLGLVAIWSPLTTWGINSLEKEYISHGIAINNTLRQVSGAIGSAILITLMTNAAKSSNVNSHVAASIHGMNVSFRIAGILIAIGLVGIILYIKDEKVEEEYNISNIIQEEA